MSIPNVVSYGATVHGFPIINETACEFLHRFITSTYNKYPLLMGNYQLIKFKKLKLYSYPI